MVALAPYYLFSLPLQQLLRDDEFAYFHAAASDFAGLDGAVEGVDLHVLHEPHAAEDLHPLVAADLDGVRGGDVRRRGEEVDLAAARAPGCADAFSRTWSRGLRSGGETALRAAKNTA